jgi:RNA polymerase sigma factor (sigma-70 family)
MTDDSSFDWLTEELAANSPAAAEAVVRRHFGRIVQVVQARIGRRFRAKVDAEEVANSAMKSFFRRYAGDRTAVTDWQDLWNLLAEIALNKLRNRIRRFRQQRRDVDREQAGGPEPDVAGVADGPEAEVVLNDLFDHLVSGYGEAERRVVELSLQGYSVDDIAAAVGVGNRTVIRIRTGFRNRLQSLRDAGG